LNIQIDQFHQINF